MQLVKEIHQPHDLQHTMLLALFSCAACFLPPEKVQKGQPGQWLSKNSTESTCGTQSLRPEQITPLCYIHDVSLKAENNRLEPLFRPEKADGMLYTVGELPRLVCDGGQKEGQRGITAVEENKLIGQDGMLDVPRIPMADLPWLIS